MKTFLIGLLCIASFLNSFAQEKSEGYLNHIFRVDFMAPGLGGEIRLGPIQTLEISANLGFGPSFNLVDSDESGDNNSYFLIAPEVHTQLRFYFNQEQRLEKSRSVYNNSGLFAGIHFGYYSPELYSSDEHVETTHAFNAGPVFGVQRTFAKHVQISFSFGLGFQWSDSRGPDLGAPGSLTFSYVILPKRNKVVLD
jgi:hypothetical protein